MKSKRIKKIFEDFFKYPNPIFCVPMMYFKCGNYLCEVAGTKTMGDMRWNNSEFTIMNPLLILEALFVDSGYYITVLERNSRNSYTHRIADCQHFSTRRELNSIINKFIRNQEIIISNTNIYGRAIQRLWQDGFCHD